MYKRCCWLVIEFDPKSKSFYYICEHWSYEFENSDPVMYSLENEGQDDLETIRKIGFIDLNLIINTNGNNRYASRSVQHSHILLDKEIVKNG